MPATSAIPVPAKSSPSRRSIPRAAPVNAIARGCSASPKAVTVPCHQRRVTVNVLSIVEWFSPQSSRQRIW